MKFVDVWQGLMGSLSGCPPEVINRPVTDVVVDSRAVRPGALFVALPGEKTDGHLYVGDAFLRGAIAAIAEPRSPALGLSASYVAQSGAITRQETGPHMPSAATSEGGPPYVFVVPDSLAGLQRLASFWRGQMAATAIAITGSVGKTTTKETVADVLEQHYVTLRSEGNLNNEIGLPLTLLRLRPEHQRVVLEMGMYALGEISSLCRLARPRIGVVTNVGPAHLERLGTIERIAEAKAELVQSLPSSDEGGVAVLNADDPLVRAMAGLTRARVFTYGLSEGADLWADKISSEGLQGTRFRLHWGRETYHLHLPMLGRHSVHTALRAAAVGLADGLSWTEIITGLEQVRGQLRLMVAPGLRDTLLIDDTYNASPESMLAALNLMEDLARRAEALPATQGGPDEELSRGRRPIAVLGDMLELGSYEEEGHRLVGGRAAQVVGYDPSSRGTGGPTRRGGAGKLVTVGLRAQWIADEAAAAGMLSADIHATESNADAIAVLQGLIRPGDVILIKGSRALGMETIVDALSRPRPRG